MKKLILVLAIALMVASPSFGALRVYLERSGVGMTPALVDVKYSGADANSTSTMPRAFAFKIKINNQAYFDDVTNFKIGESNSVSKGYGIYPATIDINSAGGIVSNGTPVANTGDPVPGAIDTNSIVLEFGSLYYGDGNVPPSSGTLCRLSIVQNGAVGSSIVRMTDEDVYRGGLVFENGSQGDTNDVNVIVWGAPPAPATAPYPADGATGVSRAGVTMTWLAGSGATSHDVYFGTALISRGNQAGNTYPTGAMTQGVLYTWRIDEKNSIGTTTGTVWTFRVEECYKTNGPSYTNWTTLGRPSCWCFKRQCNGDGNGASGLGKPVTTTDFTNFQAGYNKTVTQLKGVVDGAGLPAICADYNHSAGLGKPVTTADFTIFQSFYNKTTTQVPQCASTYINFWTN